MNPLEWLRRQTRPLSPQHRARFLEACEAMDADARRARLAPPQLAMSTPEPQPVAVIEVDGVVTREQEQQIRDSLQVVARPPAPETRWSNMATCGCWPRYSECRCGVRTGIGG